MSTLLEYQNMSQLVFTMNTYEFLTIFIWTGALYHKSDQDTLCLLFIVKGALTIKSEDKVS